MNYLSKKPKLLDKGTCTALYPSTTLFNGHGKVQECFVLELLWS